MSEKTYGYRRSLTPPALMLLASALASCSHPIKEDDRDIDSKYRGFWGATILDTPSMVSTASGRFKCWNMAGSGNLQIADGRVVARVHGYDLSGFVNSKGEFTSEERLSGQLRFVFNGQLNADAGKGTGKLVSYIEGLGLAGCSSKVELKKTVL